MFQNTVLQEEYSLKGRICPFSSQKPQLLLADPCKVGRSQKRWQAFLELKCLPSNPGTKRKSF